MPWTCSVRPNLSSTLRLTCSFWPVPTRSSGNSCGRNYIIVIGNGSPQNSNPEKAVENLMKTRIDADLATMTASERSALKAKIINAALGNDAANWSDEMARFMRLVDVSGGSQFREAHVGQFFAHRRDQEFGIRHG